MTKSPGFRTHCVAFGLLVAVAAFTPASAWAVVWRDDLTDAEVLALAQQGQFAGVGVVRTGGSYATGTAIARRWVLTAKHVVGNGESVSFELDGQTYEGTSRGDPNSDLALVLLDASNPLPVNTTFIAPNPGHNAVGPLVWKVGYGRFGPHSLTTGGAGPTLLSPGGADARAGTNIFQSTTNLTGPNALVMQRNVSGPNETIFEVTTAPGDSGGPTFLQHENGWYIAGTTFGVIGGVGFIEANVAEGYQWITQNTGNIFATPTAPAELFWDSDFGVTGAQPGGGQWHTQRPNFEANGFNYTWENDSPIKAVFGQGGSSQVGIADQIVFSEIEFADNTSAGPFNLVPAGGTLEAAAGGGTIDAKRFSAVSAQIVGTENITKIGTGDLLISGDNSQFDAQFFLNEGTTTFQSGESFGTGGFNAGKKTTVAEGATLRLRGSGLTANEHMHINGDGFEDQGAIWVDIGHHTLTSPIALQSDSTINIDAGASLTIGGTQGSFYNPAGSPAVLTQTGEGTVVYDRNNNFSELSVVNGVVAGDGRINGRVTLTSGSELRPGDSSVAAQIGSFGTNDLSLESGSMLTIDFDPAMGLIDLVNVSGSLTLGGMLNLNLLSAPTIGQTFTVIDNDGSGDVIGGTFANGNFASALFGGETHWFDVLYNAGDGNNLALRSISAVPEPSSLLALSMLSWLAISRRKRRRVNA